MEKYIVIVYRKERGSQETEFRSQKIVISDEKCVGARCIVLTGEIM